ncbi:unnamed protein product [Protopolystoma xenopodis]|uniref:Uncharacterized protein n=1 Tax=Protopolystoma xenopodis TaxID=117903 RepID=A0A448WY46_9PLAT|nr:unnamed protein product [Protopolystoma xenopodis]
MDDFAGKTYCQPTIYSLGRVYPVSIPNTKSMTSHALVSCVQTHKCCGIACFCGLAHKRLEQGTSGNVPRLRSEFGNDHANNGLRISSLTTILTDIAHWHRLHLIAENPRLPFSHRDPCSSG